MTSSTAIRTATTCGGAASCRSRPARAHRLCVRVLAAPVMKVMTESSVMELAQCGRLAQRQPEVEPAFPVGIDADMAALSRARAAARWTGVASRMSDVLGSPFRATEPCYRAWLHASVFRAGLDARDLCKTRPGSRPRVGEYLE